MKQYLKMVDYFEGNLDGDDVYGIAIHAGTVEQCAVAHAINSHDELVQMNKELLEALEAVIDDKAPLYHDCIDNGESECGWCIARKAIAKAKGGAV